jgi:hypothetical protein
MPAMSVREMNEGIIPARRCTVTQLFHANLKEMYSFAIACLKQLRALVASRTASANDFGKGWRALEALPLTTEEAATARNRINIARSYSETAESGAADFELRLLVRTLASKLALRVASRKPR